ncbi:MAG: gliding motility protein GldM [Chitinophagaceae bacterium]|nr:MAG: gliding motility protein GldM [Chitinophagaceae bacterium]
MALPKEPRQKMINLMYLVLTALLALNVSAEILNAFKTINRSLESTNTTVNTSTSNVMLSFADKLKEPESAAKAAKWYPKAEQAVAMSKDMFDYIEGLKKQILKNAGFDPSKKKDGQPDSTFKEDNQDIATHYMIEEGKGKELLAKLENYKKNMIALGAAGAADSVANLTNEISTFMKQIDLGVPPTKAGVKDWQNAYFHMVPTVAAITILSKFQNDVRTAENRTVTLFHEQVGKVQVRYDKFAAIVGQNSNYIMPGQEIEINAGVGAFSSAAKPSITINGASAPLDMTTGQATMKVQGGGLGKHSVPVTIRFMDQDGKEQVVTKNVEYTVGQANASIALDKMNVLYIGVDNPVTIAASGGGDDRIAATIIGGGGSISKVSAGKYIVRVNSVTDDAKIQVSVDGKMAGISQFRVRTIPTPTATIGGAASGDNVNAGTIRAQAGVGAYIKDFPFELKYTVTSFTLTADTEDGDIAEAPCTGNQFSPKARQILQGLTAGRTITIDNIRAQGPDGVTRKLPSLVYYIK